MIPWFFSKKEYIFKFPDNSLISRLAVNLVCIADKDSHLVTKTWWNVEIRLMIHNVLFNQEQDPVT